MLYVKLLNSDAQAPKRSSELAAGFDLFSSTTGTIEAGKRGMVSTGVSVNMPHGVYGRIAPRSSLAWNYGLNVGAGVIDRDYTGELKVILFNHGDKPFHYKKGDRIAQLILEKHLICDTKLIDELDATERGEGGFGSTGR